jgi:coatomer subunit beta'
MVVGDGEYIIYTSLARRLDLGIVSPGATIPIRIVQEGKPKIKLYWNFGEKKDDAPKGVGAFGTEGIHGGLLLGTRK